MGKQDPDGDSIEFVSNVSPDYEKLGFKFQKFALRSPNEINIDNWMVMYIILKYL